MPTIGRVAAQLSKGMPLKKLVSSVNAGGVKLMEANGALTKAGRDAFNAEKKGLGLPQSASFKTCIEKSKAIAAQAMEEMKRAIATPKEFPAIATLKEFPAIATLKEFPAIATLKKLVK